MSKRAWEQATRPYLVAGYDAILELDQAGPRIDLRAEGRAQDGGMTLGIDDATRAVFSRKTSCPHARIRPIGNGWAKCCDCGDDTFPVSAEAAGMCEGCGRYGECFCDGHTLGGRVCALCEKKTASDVG